YIDSLPETRRCKQDGVRRFAKLLEQSALGHRSLNETRKANTRRDKLIERIHRCVARREYECAAVGGMQDLHDLARGELCKLRCSWVGHGLWQVEYRLLFEVERRRCVEHVRFCRIES